MRTATLIAVFVLFLFYAEAARAHGVIGQRFIPTTLAVEDPFASDEMDLFIVNRGPRTPEGRETSFGFEFSKRLHPDLAVSFAWEYLLVDPSDGRKIAGGANPEIGIKYVAFKNPAHEAIFSLGVNFEPGGVGAKKVAEKVTTISPALYFGKGFGDLPDAVGLLRPFAVTGAIGIALPSRTRSDDGLGEIEEHSDTLELGLALEYSLPYLQSQVRNVGLGAPFDRMIPVIELSLETPLDRGGGKTTGTVNPGLFWSGQYVQLGAEAIIPWNRDSGKNVGFLAQIHFYLDDIAPMSLGRPLFGE